MRRLSLPYLLYSLLVLGTLAFAEYRGWTPFSRAHGGQPVPRSVRDNPGAYRAHYTGSGRYVGGK
jgi:hypothetical protein